MALLQSCWTINPTKLNSSRIRSCCCCATASSKGDWISENSGVIRASPIVIGIASLGFTLLNRSLSGIPPIADASSSQSRADVLLLALSSTVLLTGLVWASIQPKVFEPVELEGVTSAFQSSLLSSGNKQELVWTWEALKKTTCCRAMVVVYNGSCVFQYGQAAERSERPGEVMGVDASSLVQGPLVSNILAAGKQCYLANLKLYPGRFELPFLPSNTQSAIIQPLGDSGVLILAGNTIRGYSSSDQMWITSIGEKLDVSLGTSFNSLF